MHPSSISPDTALRDFLRTALDADSSALPVTVYGDWERPTNGLPTDFIVVYMNGDVEGVGMDTPFAKGYIMVGLYCKMNDDGSVKKNRIKSILERIDTLIEKCATGGYHFEYDPQRFITPTTPNQTSGYSVTNLNLRWTTTSEFVPPEEEIDETSDFNQ